MIRNVTLLCFISRRVLLMTPMHASEYVLLFNLMRAKGRDSLGTGREYLSNRDLTDAVVK